MSGKILYNNIGIAALSIAFVVGRVSSMPLTKALLILPFITHKELLSYLSNGNVRIQGLEKLIIEKTTFFSNFNQRYYDNLCTSLNSIQLLNELEIAQIKNSILFIDHKFAYHKSMGRRTEKIYKASTNIALALNDDVEELYLSLRIEL
ncbi:three component ABC system middle component [Nitrosomonas sp. Nm34]|uniref:three component ABC system middle component n=1 Tax=Nitrosomonas sp. Nm34 TaxID=1881055 RepID=UPI0008E05C1C|nr:three component ABC system middle component [Nitrosomonas sp. Nm34]SFI36782.1 hypothetical protein SAMN05428978_100745 [Nitrosomonas sp. Nm34]